MDAILKYKLSPSVCGIVSCLLLIVSRFTMQNESSVIGVFNYIIVFITLCFCVHFVRGTAQLFEKHVWEMPSLITLICMPVFNLFVTAMQLIVPGAAFLQHPVFSLILVAFSLPAFFCYYFIFLVRKFHGDRLFCIVSAALFLVGGTFLLFRMCDSAVLPLLEAYTSIRVDSAVRGVIAVSNRFSFEMYLLIYLLASVCFAAFGRMLLRASKRKQYEKKKLSMTRLIDSCFA